MSDKITTQPTPCRNCSFVMPAGSRFCQECGQKYTTGKVSVWELLDELLDNVFNFDAKIFVTLRDIFIPGKLTTRFFAGKHKSYFHPLRIFLVFMALLIAAITYSLNDLTQQAMQESERRKLKDYRFWILSQVDSCRNVWKAGTKDPEVGSALDSVVYLINRIKDPVKSEEIPSAKKPEAPAKPGNTGSLKFKDGELYINADEEEIEKDTNRTVSKRKKQKQDTVWFRLDARHSVGIAAPDLEQLLPQDVLEKYHLPVYGNRKKARLAIASIQHDFEPGDTIQYEEKCRAADTTMTEMAFKDFIPIPFRFDTATPGEIPYQDMLLLTPDAILQKYKVENFFDKLIVKQTIKVQMDLDKTLLYVIQMLLWVFVLLLPVMALFLKLLYIRRQRFYMEHLVFLMHNHTFAFLCIAIQLFSEKLLAEWQSIQFYMNAGILLYLFMAMKWYYQQGWFKTIFKFGIFSTTYILVFSLILTGTLFVSLMFF